MVVSWLEYIGYGFGCAVSGQVLGYFLGLRETKRRLKRHQEVTDRLMGRTPGDMSGGFSDSHDDKIDAAALSGTVYPTYGGISRSSNAFTATGIRNQAGLLGGASMQNPITYSATPSIFSSIAGKTGGSSPIAEQSIEFEKKLYEELKKAMK